MSQERGRTGLSDIRNAESVFELSQSLLQHAQARAPEATRFFFRESKAMTAPSITFEPRHLSVEAVQKRRLRLGRGPAFPVPDPSGFKSRIIAVNGTQPKSLS
jgi:hypothetical protein